MQKPPFQFNSKILSLVANIQELSGQLKAYQATKPSLKLRKENKIRSVCSSLAIEGNPFDEDQISAILENKRVVGPKAQIKEVQNALQVYDSIEKYNPLNEKHLLRAHKDLMSDLIEKPGQYRLRQVGVFKGTKVSHVAPPAKQVPALMTNLFNFLKTDDETPWLIKACVFHYELEFIHPFEDGNGRIGRFWQQLLLMKQSFVFEYISTETLIHERQSDYYKILEKCDRAGDSTLFIEFSLENILICLTQFHKSYHPTRVKVSDRLSLAIEHFGRKIFSRKDYLDFNKGISTATASRDLALGVKNKRLVLSGDKKTALYAKIE